MKKNHSKTLIALAATTSFASAASSVGILPFAQYSALSKNLDVGGALYFEYMFNKSIGAMAFGEFSYSVFRHGDSKNAIKSIDEKIAVKVANPGAAGDRTKMKAAHEAAFAELNKHGISQERSFNVKGGLGVTYNMPLGKSMAMKLALIPAVKFQRFKVTVGGKDLAEEVEVKVAEAGVVTVSFSNDAKAYYKTGLEGTATAGSNLAGQVSWATMFLYGGGYTANGTDATKGKVTGESLQVLAYEAARIASKDPMNAIGIGAEVLAQFDFMQMKNFGIGAFLKVGGYYNLGGEKVKMKMKDNTLLGAGLVAGVTGLSTAVAGTAAVFNGFYTTGTTSAVQASNIPGHVTFGEAKVLKFDEMFDKPVETLKKMVIQANAFDLDVAGGLSIGVKF